MSVCSWSEGRRASPAAFLTLISVLALFLSACASVPEHAGEEKLYWRAPVLLPQVSPELRQPGFWVGRLPSPDEVVMDGIQIDAFNRDLLNRNLVRDVLGPEGSVAEVGPKLAKDWDWLSHRTYYLPDGSKAGPQWWGALEPQMNLGAADLGGELYALATTWTDQRVLPDRTRLTGEVFDTDFDEFQNSGYDLGTEFRLFRASVDGRWLWGRGALSDGWLDRGTLAFCDRQTLEDWKSRETVVVTAARAGLWADGGRRVWKTWLRMGTRLPVEADEGDLWRVTLPTVGSDGRAVFVSGWIAKAEAVRGSLPYTRRTIAEQAFQLLDRPYGWGDSYGEQDCSRFIAQIFSTVGINLPRNSASQGVSGLDSGRFVRTDPTQAKTAAVAAADPLTTVLRLDGHIMLYLGSLDGTPYVIHCLWAYTQMDGNKEVVRVVNGVAVSTLTLSEGSKRGSLLERLRNVRSYGPLPEPGAEGSLPPLP